MLQPPQIIDEKNAQSPPPTWHRKIARLLKIFAILGLIVGIQLAISHTGADDLLHQLDTQSAQYAITKVMQQHTQLIFSIGLIQALLAFLLLLASSGIKHKKFPAVKLTLFWATIKIAFVIIAIPLAYPLFTQSYIATIQSPEFKASLETNQLPLNPQSQEQLSQTLAVITSAVLLLWLLALPLFTIFFFNRKHIKPQVFSWITQQPKIPE